MNDDMKPTDIKITIRNLYKIFGDDPETGMGETTGPNTRSARNRAVCAKGGRPVV